MLKAHSMHIVAKCPFTEKFKFGAILEYYLSFALYLSHKLMKHLFLITSLTFTLFSLTANSQTNKGTDIAAINKDSLGKEISVLASDAFQGRKPFTAGETKTINYLKNEFQSIGLEPGNGKSYFQDVPMVNIVSKAAPAMQVQTPKGSFQLKGFDDYVIST